MFKAKFKGRDDYSTLKQMSPEERDAFYNKSYTDSIEAMKRDIRKFNIDKLHSFFFNFLVYLHASNKDVEESECSKGAFSKPINKNKEPKNKFSEIRQYEVGYRISSPYPKKKGTTISLGSGGGSPKSSHYRSGHWHHFWTGSGADKKLIVKWVDGVFVNGKAEQSVAVVHSVK